MDGNTEVLTSASKQWGDKALKVLQQTQKLRKQATQMLTKLTEAHRQLKIQAQESTAKANRHVHLNMEAKLKDLGPSEKSATAEEEDVAEAEVAPAPEAEVAP